MKSSIILAAGLGKRVREYSSNLPKPLIAVNGKPFIEYSINIMEELGFEEIFINVHYKSDQIMSYLKNLNNKSNKSSQYILTKINPPSFDNLSIKISVGLLFLILLLISPDSNNRLLLSISCLLYTSDAADE